MLQMQCYNFLHVNAKGNAYKNSGLVLTMALDAVKQVPATDVWKSKRG